MTSRSRSLFLSLGILAACVPGMLGACSATGGGKTFTTGTGGGDPGTTGLFTTSGEGGFNLGGGGPGGGSGSGGDPTTCAQAAANKTYLGCDFWPTVVDNYVWSIFDYAVVVANAGTAPVDVTVERNGAKVAGTNIAPNSLRTIYLPWVMPLKSADAPDICGVPPLNAATVRANGGAYHLVATAPVTVYQFNAIEYQGAGGPPGKSWANCPGDICPGFPGCFSFTNDASLLLPSTAMTGNYRITGQAGWPDAAIGPYFAVTGTEDGTSVTVNVGAKGHIVGGAGIASTSANGSTTFSLDAGDVVEIVGDPSSDFSGSLVKATKPVQVITGIACTQSPIGFQACDHIEESVFPAETLGKHYFVTVPTSPNGDVVGHVVRIYGNADGTTLNYPGPKPSGAPKTINAGQVVDLGQVSQDFEITGDHEFAVGSFQLGAEIVDPIQLPPEQKGDPAQSLATAVEQYRTKYVFLAPADYDVSFVDVIEPTGATVTIDGVAIAAPKPISSGFGVSRVALGPGNGGAHVLTASAPVGIQVMGYGAYTSYQYPGGLNLDAIAPPPPK